MAKKKKETTNSSTTSNVVSTPTNATWVEPSIQAQQTKINSLLDTDPQSLVAEPSSLQQQAFGAAAGLLGPAPQPPQQARPGMSPGQMPPMPPRGGLPAGQPMGGMPGQTQPADGYPVPTADERRAAGGVNGGGGYATDDFSQPAPGGGTVAGAIDKLSIGSKAGPAGTSPMGPAASPAAAPTLSANDWRAGNTAAQGAAQGLLDSHIDPAQATSRGILDTDLNAYQNPYLDSVVKSSLAGFDEQSGMREAQLAAQQARGQKFSGSGSAIENALFKRGEMQDRTGIESDLRSAGFDKATGLATSDLNREADTSRFNVGQTNTMSVSDRDAQLRSAGLLGDLSSQGGADNRADVSLLGTLGGQQRDIAQQQASAPAALLQLIASLNNQQPYDLFKGGTTNSTGTGTSKTKSSEFGLSGEDLGKIAAAAAMASGSDARIKRDVVTDRYDEAGVRWVTFSYLWDEPDAPAHYGVIAQEVREIYPDVVLTHPMGFLMVDYDKLQAKGRVAA